MRKIILLILLVVFKVGYSQVISPTEIDESYNYKANVVIYDAVDNIILPDGKLLVYVRHAKINNVSTRSAL